MSDSSSNGSYSPEHIPHNKPPSPPKRKVSAAGMDVNGTGRPVKRRASKACQCCRARKVRCNVTEHGAPCTNCRLDEVECIVSESRRKKKWTKDQDSSKSTAQEARPGTVTAKTSLSGHRPLAQRQDSRDTDRGLAATVAPYSHDIEPRQDGHVPHSIYQTHNNRNYGFQEQNRRMSMGSTTVPTLNYSLSADTPVNSLPQLAPKLPVTLLPLYIKPLPHKIGPAEISYLEKKGALTVPNVALRNELISAFIDYVYPFMPLLELHDFLQRVDREDGTRGQVSLILFQAVMFAGSAFADMSHLQMAGYSSRKEARKDFFQRTRLLYDFDYESDRVSLVQALLLLTYYYETPDDQKDTWHWMGVATSVAYTIGLHRNPEKSNMSPNRVRLWKRIWWSTCMRDRLIALGMRRPTRIKDPDTDVPMLALDDFEISAIPNSISCAPASCSFARDVGKQRELAVMCIEKAKLCNLINLVLSKQYCVLNNQQGVANDRTTMMLLPKQPSAEACEVKACDEALQNWVAELPEEACYSEQLTGDKVRDLHRSLLHMTYFTTSSALHRPQVLPAVPVKDSDDAIDPEILKMSRLKVRESANALTSIAAQLDAYDLVKYLPTTGVTCLLPAIIIHLLDIKSPEEGARLKSLRGFTQCMMVMGKLRELYAAADYSIAFLEAAIRKAGIQLPMNDNATVPVRPKFKRCSTVEDLVSAGRRLDDTPRTINDTTFVSSNMNLTPPPDTLNTSLDSNLITPEMLSQGADGNVTEEEMVRRLGSFLDANTPPSSDGTASDNDSPNTLDLQGTEISINLNAAQISGTEEYDYNDAFDEMEFDTLLNLDAVGGETFASFGQDTVMQLPNEMDWLQVMAA